MYFKFALIPHTVWRLYSFWSFAVVIVYFQTFLMPHVKNLSHSDSTGNNHV